MAVVLARAVDEAHPEPPELFGPVSKFLSLSPEEQARILLILESNGDLDDLRKGLRSLNVLYPRSPLQFITNDWEHASDPLRHDVEDFKEVLMDLFDKTSRQAIIMQGTLIYVAFELDRLRVAPGIGLAQLPELENYPDTAESRLVAASVRSAVPLLVRPPEEAYETAWSAYFWNRGLEIEPCRAQL
ncbi:MAG: hypothetical protein FD171_1272 [Actinobacteria bacterium]|nr:MAG: hypothetical protein FD171_1272 [Actinomycetota bacterium]